MTIAEQIQKLRTDNHLSVRAFAEAVGVMDSTARGWEWGAGPSSASLAKIEAVFHVRIVAEKQDNPEPASRVLTSGPRVEKSGGIIQRWQPHEGHHFTKPYRRRREAAST